MASSNTRNGNNNRREDREPDKRQPDFVIRAKVNGFWTTLGAAWSADLKDGTGYSVKFNVLPVGWDGDGLMMPPLAKD